MNGSAAREMGEMDDKERATLTERQAARDVAEEIATKQRNGATRELFFALSRSATALEQVRDTVEGHLTWPEVKALPARIRKLLNIDEGDRKTVVVPSPKPANDNACKRCGETGPLVGEAGFCVDVSACLSRPAKRVGAEGRPTSTPLRDAIGKAVHGGRAPAWEHCSEPWRETCRAAGERAVAVARASEPSDGIDWKARTLAAEAGWDKAKEIADRAQQERDEAMATRARKPIDPEAVGRLVHGNDRAGMPRWEDFLPGYREACIETGMRVLRVFAPTDCGSVIAFVNDNFQGEFYAGEEPAKVLTRLLTELLSRRKSERVETTAMPKPEPGKEPRWLMQERADRAREWLTRMNERLREAIDDRDREWEEREADVLRQRDDAIKARDDARLAVSSLSAEVESLRAKRTMLDAIDERMAAIGFDGVLPFLANHFGYDGTDRPGKVVMGLLSDLLRSRASIAGLRRDLKTADDALDRISDQYAVEAEEHARALFAFDRALADLTRIRGERDQALRERAGLIRTIRSIRLIVGASDGEMTVEAVKRVVVALAQRCG